MADDFDQVFDNAPSDRRTFLRRLAIGTAFAVPVVSSFSMAGISAAYAGSGHSKGPIRNPNSTSGGPIKNPNSTGGGPIHNPNQDCGPIRNPNSTGGGPIKNPNSGSSGHYGRR